MAEKGRGVMKEKGCKEGYHKAVKLLGCQLRGLKDPKKFRVHWAYKCEICGEYFTLKSRVTTLDYRASMERGMEDE